MEVRFTDDPAAVLACAQTFLEARPVDHNVMLTLLNARVAAPIEGRYWSVHDGSEVVGVVFQSPVTFSPTLTPMPREAVAAVVDTIASSGVDLPGVIGDAETAARFAGRWTDSRRAAARPIMGQRLYELTDLTEPTGVAGHLRIATEDDVPLLVEWMHGFNEDAGERGQDPALMVPVRVAAGQFHVWADDGEPVSTAAVTAPMAGVTRVQAVYTPPARRGRGYAGATVGALSRRQLDEGLRCILYTDLGNPTSNSVYRRLGYRAVAELLRYEFVS